jgi:3D (Asp-Asp-Asp) domain-containing protein
MKRLTTTSVIAGILLGAVAGASLALASKRGRRIIDVAATARALVTTRPRLDWQVPEPPAGDRLGSFQLTYYWMPTETGGGRRVQLYDRRCRPVAVVSSSFARHLRLEGGGQLRDGRVLTYSGACRCDTSPCFRLARRGHTWGTGVQERPLSPFRSVAVDPRLVSIGATLYVPELDGMTMPGSPPWGAFVHDGCVVADDQGGGVRGRQLDLFAARRSHYRALDRRHRLRRVTVFDGGERCRSLERRPAARRGSI